MKVNIELGRKLKSPKDEQSHPLAVYCSELAFGILHTLFVIKVLVWTMAKLHPR